MLEDLLKENPVKEMKPYEKAMERLKRDKNILELENKAMKKIIDKARKKAEVVDRANSILEKMDIYLTDRIEKIGNKNERATYELMRMLKAIKEEKELMK